MKRVRLFRSVPVLPQISTGDSFCFFIRMLIFEGVCTRFTFLPTEKNRLTAANSGSLLNVFV